MQNNHCGLIASLAEIHKDMSVTHSESLDHSKQWDKRKWERTDLTGVDTLSISEIDLITQQNIIS